MKQKYKVIIDTNLWISFLLSKKFNFIDRLLDNGKYNAGRTNIDNLTAIESPPNNSVTTSGERGKFILFKKPNRL